MSISTDMKFRPQPALTRPQLAEMLLEHHPKDWAEALDHPDFAVEEVRGEDTALALTDATPEAYADDMASVLRSSSN